MHRRSRTPGITRFGVVAMATAAMTTCTDGPGDSVAWTPGPGMTRDAPTPPSCAADPDLPVPEEVASGLEVPWDLASLPDGRMLVVERPGRIRVIEDGVLRPEPWATLDVTSVAETGLLGIAVDPDFESNGHVYVVGTFVDTSLPARIGRRISRLFDSAAGEAWKNRLVRLTERDGRGVGPTVVIDELKVGPIHAGGALSFGPDRRLYLGLGDGSRPERAADPAAVGGKVHVIDLDSGTRSTYSRGLRNPQAIAIHPISGDLFSTDHGPSGLANDGRRSGSDELNRLTAGGDYGWPSVAGGWDGVPSHAPVVEWITPIAPGGVAFVDDTASSWYGDAVVAGLVGQKLVRVTDPTATGAEGVDPGGCVMDLYVQEFGRLRAVHFSRDGHLWFTTSNRDERGIPRPGDDRILRFRPPG